MGNYTVTPYIREKLPKHIEFVNDSSLTFKTEMGKAIQISAEHGLLQKKVKILYPRRLASDDPDRGQHILEYAKRDFPDYEFETIPVYTLQRQHRDNRIDL